LDCLTLKMNTLQFSGNLGNSSTTEDNIPEDSSLQFL